MVMVTVVMVVVMMMLMVMVVMMLMGVMVVMVVMDVVIKLMGMFPVKSGGFVRHYGVVRVQRVMLLRHRYSPSTDTASAACSKPTRINVATCSSASE